MKQRDFWAGLNPVHFPRTSASDPFFQAIFPSCGMFFHALWSPSFDSRQAFVKDLLCRKLDTNFAGAMRDRDTRAKNACDCRCHMRQRYPDRRSGAACQYWDRQWPPWIRTIQVINNTDTTYYNNDFLFDVCSGRTQRRNTTDYGHNAYMMIGVIAASYHRGL